MKAKEKVKQFHRAAKSPATARTKRGKQFTMYFDVRLVRSFDRLTARQKIKNRSTHLSDLMREAVGASGRGQS